MLDVVRNVDGSYATSRAARRRAAHVAGLSEGGYGATNVALHHLRDFATFESWSSLLPRRPGPDVERLQRRPDGGQQPARLRPLAHAAAAPLPTTRRSLTAAAETASQQQRRPCGVRERLPRRRRPRRHRRVHRHAQLVAHGGSTSRRCCASPARTSRPSPVTREEASWDETPPLRQPLAAQPRCSDRRAARCADRDRAALPAASASRTGRWHAAARGAAAAAARRRRRAAAVTRRARVRRRGVGRRCRRRPADAGPAADRRGGDRPARLDAAAAQRGCLRTRSPTPTASAPGCSRS